MFLKENFCERLRTARIDANMTQSDVASVLGKKKQYVSRWEIGVTEPNLEQLHSLCEILSVSADYLLGLNETSLLK